MLSIICPTYNSMETINDLINSMLSQRSIKNNLEIIFIDDGSTDKTVKLLEKGVLKLQNNKYKASLYKSKHKGPGAARNLGIKNSQFDYIAFIDSDDIWYEEKIYICHETILNNPEYNIFIHDEDYVRANGRRNKIINGNFKGPLHKSLYIKNCLSTSAVVLKKDLFLKYGNFDENLMSSQDYDLWLKFSKHLMPYKINQVLGEYRETKTSITSKFYLYRFVDQLIIAHRYKHYVNILQYFKKLLKIVFNKQWIFGIKNIILRRQSHNY
jgi:glycosyltransferase involved in cell wall biosynthesis